mmetsp:Transcript_30129/g.52057  ORF Transcript_30129/g.52057 Transcript_30129/m.52057 type:complete len:237 (-) Transcript_30129:51-761(-)
MLAQVLQLLVEGIEGAPVKPPVQGLLLVAVLQVEAVDPELDHLLRVLREPNAMHEQPGFRAVQVLQRLVLVGAVGLDPVVRVPPGGQVQLHLRRLRRLGDLALRLGHAPLVERVVPPLLRAGFLLGVRALGLQLPPGHRLVLVPGPRQLRAAHGLLRARLKEQDGVRELAQAKLAHGLLLGHPGQRAVPVPLVVPPVARVGPAVLVLAAPEPVPQVVFELPGVRFTSVVECTLSSS